MQEFKLGRKPAVFPPGLRDLMTYVAQAPQRPPAVVMPPNVGGWPMFGNDQAGDCVLASCAHALQDYNAVVNEHDPIPNEAAVLGLYWELTGGQDTGLVISDVLEHWRTTGLWGNRIAAYAPLKLRSWQDMHMAIAWYGGVKVGVNFPQSAMDQFSVGEPWTVLPSDGGIIGGHDVWAAGYDQQWYYVITWGKVQRVAYPWFEAYAEEKWACIAHQFVEAGRGPRLDLKALEADLPLLAR